VLFGIILLLFPATVSAMKLSGTTTVDVQSSCYVSAYVQDINVDKITPLDNINWLYTEYRLIPVTEENVEQFAYDIYRMALSTGATEAIPSTAVVIVNRSDPSQKILYLPIIVVPRKLNAQTICDVKYFFWIQKPHISVTREINSTPPTNISDQFEVDIDGNRARVVVALELRDPIYYEPFPGTDERYIDFLQTHRFLAKYGRIAPSVITTPVKYFDDAILEYFQEQNRSDLVAKLEQIVYETHTLFYIERYPLYVHIPEQNEITVVYVQVPEENFSKYLELAPYTFKVGEYYDPPYLTDLTPEDLSHELHETYSTTASYVITFGTPTEVNKEVEEGEVVRDLEISSVDKVYVTPKRQGTFWLFIHNPNDINASVRVCITPIGVAVRATDLKYQYQSSSWCKEDVIPPHEDVRYELNVLYVTAPNGTKLIYSIDAFFKSPELVSEIYRHYGGEIEVRSSYYGYESFCLDENHLAMVENQAYVKQVILCGKDNKCYQISRGKAICYDHEPLPGELTAREYRQFIEKKGDIVGFLLFGSTGLIADGIELALGVKLGEIPLMAGVGGFMVALGALALAYYIYKSMPDDCPYKNYAPILSLITGFFLGSLGVLGLNVVIAAVCYTRKTRK